MRKGQLAVMIILLVPCRLYGQGSFKSPKEKREQQNEITELQTKAASNAPNYEILNKLRIEMLKLAKEQTEQKVRIQ